MLSCVEHAELRFGTGAGGRCDGGVERWGCQCEVIRMLSDIDKLAAEGRSRVSEDVA